MTYYTLVIKEYNNGTEKKTGLYDHGEDFDAAQGDAHKQYGQNVQAETIHSIMCTVINSVGAQFKEHTLYWEEPSVKTDSSHDNTIEATE